MGPKAKSKKDKKSKGSDEAPVEETGISMIFWFKI